MYSSRIQRSSVFTAGLGEYPHFRIPSLVTTSAGVLLAFCEGRGLQGGTHGDISGNQLALRRSVDCGQTWGPVELVAADNPSSLLGPAAVATDTGRIVLVYHRYGPGTTEHNGSAGFEGPRVVSVMVTTSDDDGGSWSRPRDITRCAKKQAWSGSILTGPGLGVQKRRAPNVGRIVVPCCHGPVGAWHDFVICSDDNGESWHLGGEVPDPLGNECQVVELTDGRLMLNARSYRERHCRHVTTSCDGGRSWEQGRDERAHTEPVCQGSIFRFSDPLDGEPSRLLFANPADPHRRVNGTVKLSLDEGDTWPHSLVLEPGVYGYSCLTRQTDGRVGCLYEAEDNEIVFATFELEALSVTGW